MAHAYVVGIFDTKGSELGYVAAQQVAEHHPDGADHPGHAGAARRHTEEQPP